MKTLILAFFIGTGILVKAQDYYEVNLFPNPASDIMFIDVPHGFTGITNIYVCDFTGHVLNTLQRNFDGMESPTMRRTEIQVGGLPKGVYFLNIRDNDRWITKQFMKQ